MNYTYDSYVILYNMRCEELWWDYVSIGDYENFKDLMPFEAYDSITKSKANRRNKRYRVFKKIKEMIYLNQFLHNKGKMIFISIQPNDDILETKEDTYMRKINNWLKKECLMSIVNKDYGDRTGREHYHAMALTCKEIEQLFHEDGTPKKSNTGRNLYEFKNKEFAKMCKCKDIQFEPTIEIVDYDDSKATMNYLLKLNNHSNKSTTKSRIRIIKSPLMRMFELRVNR